MKMQRLICTLVGHHQPVRATEVWDSVWRRWNPINDTTNIAVCARCGRELSGWLLTVR